MPAGLGRRDRVNGTMVCCLLCLLSAAGLAADADCDEDAASCAPKEAANGNWVDSSYEFVTSRSDALAQWLDSFFGTPTSDRESADTMLRLRSELSLDEGDSATAKVRLRGKVDLPRLSKRLSLVFSEDNEDREEVVPETSGHNDVGLQLNVYDRGKSRWWMTLSTNSSLDLRANLRYKYVRMFGEDWRLQFGEKFYWKQDDGFGALTRVDLDYLLATDRMVRWTNQVDYGEDTAGVEWGSRLSYQVRLDSKQALSYFTTASGRTRPEYFTRNYGIGVRYRRNVFRPWIFFEIEPVHMWRRDAHDEAREPVWLLTFRLEFLEERTNRHHRKRRDAACETVLQ